MSNRNIKQRWEKMSPEELNRQCKEYGIPRVHRPISKADMIARLYNALVSNPKVNDGNSSLPDEHGLRKRKKATTKSTTATKNKNTDDARTAGSYYGDVERFLKRQARPDASPSSTAVAAAAARPSDRRPNSNDDDDDDQDRKPPPSKKPKGVSSPASSTTDRAATTPVPLQRQQQQHRHQQESGDSPTNDSNDDDGEATSSQDQKPAARRPMETGASTSAAAAVDGAADATTAVPSQATERTETGQNGLSDVSSAAGAASAAMAAAESDGGSATNAPPGAATSNAHRQREDHTSPLLESMLCPITHEILIDPVVAEDKKVYERSAIEEHFALRSRAIRTEDGKEVTVVLSPITGEDMGISLCPAPELIISIINGAIAQKSIPDSSAQKWIQGRKRLGEKATLIKQAESDNDPHAMYMLAKHYYRGSNGFKRDDGVAWEWAQKANTMGNASAPALLGEMTYAKSVAGSGDDSAEGGSSSDVSSVVGESRKSKNERLKQQQEQQLRLEKQKEQQQKNALTYAYKAASHGSRYGAYLCATWLSQWAEDNSDENMKREAESSYEACLKEGPGVIDDLDTDTMEKVRQIVQRFKRNQQEQEEVR